MRIQIIFALLLLNAFAVLGQKGFTFKENKSAKKIQVLYNGKLLTAYCYFDSTEKPILYPIKTISGTTITRGFPIAPRAGERADHPHQAGLWFTYESVNGLDFWNNSSAIAPEKKDTYGSIKHQRVLSRTMKGDNAQLVTLSHWVNKAGDVLIEETTTFNFLRRGNDFIIDRNCKLTAKQGLIFKDVKDGLLGLRVSRPLEMPSAQADRFVGKDGVIGSEEMINNDGVTGMYLNREGLKGDSVWSSQSEWAVLSGVSEGKKISIVIIDHPKNPGYPTYWHARGYGLFAANPLGRSIFSKGKETLNLNLKKDESATFQYRIVIHEGSEITPAEVNSLEKEFTFQ